MQYWLAKSEPADYSIEQLRQDTTTPWSGVRNYQVRNFMRDKMSRGDRVFFYHSNAKQDTGIVGEMEVVSEAHPDQTQFDATDDHYDEKSTVDAPRWWCVEMAFIKQFSRTLTLSELRDAPELSSMLILRKGNRLSITPLTKKEYQTIHKLVRT